MTLWQRLPTWLKSDLEMLALRFWDKDRPNQIEVEAKKLAYAVKDSTLYGWAQRCGGNVMPTRVIACYFGVCRVENEARGAGRGRDEA